MYSSEFEIIDSIGVGATSEVFKAFNKKTDKHVALKAFSSVVTHDSDCVERLKFEVEALCSLNHPNVVKLLSHSQNANHFFLELELVEGSDLRKWLESYIYELLEPKLWILSQILRGLGAAHEKGFIHRDLKLENILVSNAGAIKLTDFGLAKSIDRLTMTKMGLLVGSLGYMAPEIINGAKANIASDIFSFGAIAYEMVTHQPAFQGETPQAMIKKITDQNFTPLNRLAPHCPPAIAEIIDSCLNRDPEQRPTTVWDIDAALMSVLIKSQLLPYCERMVSTSTQIDLKKILEIKHAQLSSSLKQQMDKDLSSRKEAIALANELQRLYPDDKLGAEILAQMTKKKATPGLYKFACAAALLIALLFGLKTLSPLWTESEKLAPKPTANAKIKTIEKPIVSKAKLPPAKSIKKPIPLPVRSRFGRLQFLVDPGVQVYVDGALVPSNRLNNYPVKVGSHTIKLAKPGFLPITNSIKVRKGKPTIIRAQGVL